jgi:ABC-2 type transport system permease protein
MKALLLKDFYVMWKQTRVLLLLILVFSCLPGAFYPTFAVVYAAILPYTAMAYDERSKWGQLAAMLPYADREIVLSKYCFGYLAIAVAAGISLVLQTVLTAVWDRAAENLSPLSSILLAICMGVGVLALTLPLMFRFGVEKGRLVMFLIIFLVCGGAGAVTGITSELSDSGRYLMTLALPGAALAAVILTAVSIPLSLRMYRRRA